MKLFEGEKRAAFGLMFRSFCQSVWQSFAEGGGKYTEEEKEKLKKKGWDTNAITPGKFLVLDLVVRRWILTLYICPRYSLHGPSRSES